MIVVCIIAILCCLALIIGLIIYSDSKNKKYISLKEIEQQCQNLSKEYESIEQKYNQKKAILDNYDESIRNARQRLQDANDLADKQYFIAYAEKEKEFNTQLEKELEELQKSHPIETYKQEVVELLNEINDARDKLKLIQNAEKEKAETEDYNSLHSIHISDSDKYEIATIKEFASKLVHKDLLYKLIWQTFYQTPLQALRKTLAVDKVTGIYKITNIANGKSYVGQAKDVGERFTEHLKKGLGIGSNDFLFNKFYSEMFKLGPESFTFELIESCGTNELNEKEKFWIDYYNCIQWGYNSK